MTLQTEMGQLLLAVAGHMYISFTLAIRALIREYFDYKRPELLWTHSHLPGRSLPARIERVIRGEVARQQSQSISINSCMIDTKAEVMAYIDTTYPDDERKKSFIAVWDKLYKKILNEQPASASVSDVKDTEHCNQWLTVMVNSDSLLQLNSSEASTPTGGDGAATYRSCKDTVYMMN